MTAVLAVLDRATSWLSPERRRNIYQLASLLGTLLIGMGVTDAELTTTYVAAGITVVEALTILLSAVKARLGRARAAYLLLGAVFAVLKIAGVLTDGQESHWLELAGHVIAVLPIMLAVLRTDPRTPSGEPLVEYVAKHGALVVDPGSVIIATDGINIHPDDLLLVEERQRRDRGGIAPGL